MQWTYEIRGSHPQYKIPEAKGGRINNRLSTKVLKKLNEKQAVKKNFLKENLKQLHQRSPKKVLDGVQSMANISYRGGGASTAGGYRKDPSPGKSTS